MIFAGTKGYLDDIAIADVPQFENDLLEFLRDQKPEILDAIHETGSIRDEDELIGAIKEFKSLDESYRNDETADAATDKTADAATDEAAETDDSSDNEEAHDDGDGTKLGGFTEDPFSGPADAEASETTEED